MKRRILYVICAFISLLSLVGCSLTDEKTDSFEIYIEQEPSTTVVILDQVYFYISDDEYYGRFDYSALSEAAELTCVPYNFDNWDFILKILAGDSDVDIYLLPVQTFQLLKEKGLYEPIESEIIKRHNESCFDYMAELCLDDKGQTVCMPVAGSTEAIYIPKEAIEETGVTADDIHYLDNYLEFARSYDGSRKSYSIGMMFFFSIENQYENYYCDFENGTADYDTDLYRHIYEELLSGYQRYGQKPGNIEGFVHAATAPAHNYTNTLFDLSGNYSDFISESDQWRAFPMPRISDKVDKQSATLFVAYINPYSRNKENALKVLETAAENFDAVTELAVWTPSNAGYPFVKKDKSDYGARYNTDTDLFNDYYNLMADGYISSGWMSSYREDIDDYQNGRTTLDEAIAAYQREVEIWLNE